MDEEFDSLAGLAQAFGELDATQTDQERLTQALTISKLLSRKENRALISVTPPETTLVIPWKLVKNTVPWRLRTQDLPPLHHYATKLCTCLDPSSIRSDTDDRLREALQILPQVNHYVHQMNTTIASVWDPPKPEDSEQHTTQWTVQRCHRLIYEYKTVLSALSFIFSRFESFFTEFIPDDPTVGSTTDYLLPTTIRNGLKLIKQVITWLDQSNFAELRNGWEWDVVFLDRILHELAELEGSSHIKYSQEKSIVREQIQGLVPLVKLSRLLFNKLCKFTNSQPRLVSHTNLEVLEALREATFSLPYHPSDISRTFDWPRPHFTKLAHSMNALEKSFKNIKLILNQHVDSLESTCESDAQQACRQWSQLWIHQYNLAMENFRWISHDHIMDDMTDLE